jgi:hypothetical protein
MAVEGVAPLPAADEEGRGADCRGLPGRHQHPAREAGAVSLFEGALSKDVVSRAWLKVKVDRDAWCARSLADECQSALKIDPLIGA